LPAYSLQLNIILPVVSPPEVHGRGATHAHPAFGVQNAGFLFSRSQTLHVRFWPIADIASCTAHVRVHSDFRRSAIGRYARGNAQPTLPDASLSSSAPKRLNTIIPKRRPVKPRMN